MFKIVEFSHLLINEYLKFSSLKQIRCLDATCGNGNDTIYLAKSLNSLSTIHAYDIQPDAILNTLDNLKKESINNVTLFLNSHEFINPSLYDLVIFNLGFLPNGNKEITTLTTSTMIAVEKLTKEVLNNEHMLIIICVYPGHEEGKIESMTLDGYVKKLSSSDYLVTKYLNYNRPTSPYILTISKNKRH